MTIKAEIMIGQCDATFLGNSPLEKTIPHEGALHSSFIYSGGVQEINIEDYGSRGGGSIRLSTRLEDFGSVFFTGGGLKGFSTNMLNAQREINTIALLKAGGEVVMHLSSRRNPKESALIKFSHTIDTI